MHTLSKLRHATAWAVVLLAACVLGGCSGVLWKRSATKADAAAKADPSAKKTPAPPAGTQVRVGGDGFALGDVEQPACSSQQFVDRVAELLRNKRPAEAAQWVQRYPDVALGVLREPGSVHTEPNVLQVVAQAHDQQCAHCNADAGWTAVIADRTAHPERHSDYDVRRQQFMGHLQNGRLKEALALGLSNVPAGVPGPLLAIDAHRLTGIALVLDNRPAEAVAAFQQALQLAGQAHPYQAANVLLLVSDAHRRAGNPAAAEGAWVETARLASELAGAPQPAIDPILWERVAYLRPVNCPWPSAVRQRLVDLNVGFGVLAETRGAVQPVSMTNSVADEGPLWTSIGHWRLAREEPQAALVALKRAETLSGSSYVAGRLQMGQSKALVRLGQHSAATAMLISLAGSSDMRISRPAMAMLGTMKLKQGSTQQGFNLLRRAVEEDQAAMWPDRADAEADLGLAYLLMGDEAAGLRWLHTAQQGFEIARQHEQLVQCLENEAAYLEQAKKRDLAAAVRRRLESLQGS
jgi:tetratricopeptide (TPR) repeat protein